LLFILNNDQIKKISKGLILSICSINELLLLLSTFDQLLSLSSLIRNSELEYDEIYNIYIKLDEITIFSSKNQMV